MVIPRTLIEIAIILSFCYVPGTPLHCVIVVSILCGSASMDAIGILEARNQLNDVDKRPNGVFLSLLLH